jgi:hypothetical protein
LNFFSNTPYKLIRQGNTSNDRSLAPKEREQREERLALFQEQKTIP